MNKIYSLKVLVLILLMSFAALNNASAQCVTGVQIGTLNAISPVYQTQVISPGAPAYYSFTAVTGGVYVFTYCSNGGSYSGDPYLTIATNAAVSLTQNDDFCGLGSQITWTCPATGIYRVYVSGCCPCSNAPSAVLAYGCSSCTFLPPSVSNFSPATGCTFATSVVITGSNFLGASAVTFGGTAAQSFVVNNASQITAIVAGGTTGVIAVTTPGGTASSGATFTVNATPTVTASTPTPVICVGASANISAAGNGVSYTWNPGGLVGANQTVTPAASTVYTVTSTSAAGCSATSTLAISVSPMQAQPSPVTATPNLLCGGGTSQLNATGTLGSTINWYSAAVGGTFLGASPSGVNFPVSPAVTTTYYAEAYSNIVGSQTFNYTGALPEHAPLLVAPLPPTPPMP